MPGGVGGARSGILTAPIPIHANGKYWPAPVIIIHDNNQ